MEDNPQVANFGYFEVLLDNTLFGIEFIKHRDLHLYMYINGAKTDVIFPRHLDLYNCEPYGNTFNYDKFIKNTDKLILGKKPN